MTSQYKSEEGKKKILALYEAKLDSLGLEYEERTLSTHFGHTHCLVTGDPSHPPLIIVHGSNGCAPISLETYPNLSKSFRVYAVDVLAQPNKSEGTRLSMKDDSYGKWMHQVISALELEEVTLIGFSFGGLVILKTLLHKENPIKEVYLAAPAYIVNGNPLKALFRVFIPMKRYMRTQKPKFVEKFLQELFTSRDEFAVRYLSEVFLHFKMDFTPVPTISKKEAARIQTPIILFAAKDDLIFPGEKMLKRAKKIFPSLKKTVLLRQSKHVQNRSDNDKIEQEVLQGS